MISLNPINLKCVPVKFAVFIGLKVHNSKLYRLYFVTFIYSAHEI